jgi:hypothetical protein
VGCPVHALSAFPHEQRLVLAQQAIDFDEQTDKALAELTAAPELLRLRRLWLRRRRRGGWLLRDVIRLRLSGRDLKPGSRVKVTSGSRDKQIEVTWAQVDDAANNVILALSNRGTLKLVSVLPALDTRDEWVQDVDRIEVTSP